MVVATESNGAPVGVVSAYNAEPTAGHCYVAMQRVLHDDNEGLNTKGLMVEGFFVFVQYLFDHFDFRKLYLEIPEYNRTLIAGGPNSLLVQEGELKDHCYYGDRMWSQFIYALYRAKWEEVAPAFRGDWPADH